jgi:hypothetical protein
LKARFAIASVMLAACATGDAGTRDSDSDREYVLYDQLLQLFTEDGFVVLAMVKDYPRDRADDLETFVEFVRPESAASQLRATFTRARGAPIVWQLTELLEVDPAMPFEQIVERIELDERSIDEAECPSLRAAFDELTVDAWSFNVRPKFPDELEIAIHPRIFILQSRVDDQGLRVECDRRGPHCGRLVRAYELAVSCIAAEPERSSN